MTPCGAKADRDRGADRERPVDAVAIAKSAPIAVSTVYSIVSPR